MNKGNEVIKICDGIETLLDLKGYIVFDDNWISEYDTVLYNDKDELFNVLDFKEITEEVPFYPLINPSIPIRRTYNKKFSCVKLDKNVNIGDILYCLK